jgi:hypothetical protein
MGTFEIGNQRLFYQGILEANFEEPGQVVASLGAVQAQDYAGALWAIGLRMKHATPALVEKAVADKSIVRTWPMRGTLHFVAVRDVRWMLKLLATRGMNGVTARHKQLELDEEVFSRSRELIVKALEGGKQLTRPELYRVLEDGKVAPTGQRGIHILGWFSRHGLLCQGPYRDKQPTFALLDEWLPPARELDTEEALTELTRRFFEGHGPVTLADLERWAGLKTSEARRGLEAVKPELRYEETAGQTYWLSAKCEMAGVAKTGVYLLPGFDEFILGYKDRTAVLDPQYSERIVPGGNGMFISTIVSNGRVVGLWKRAVNAKKDKLTITPVPFTTLTPDEKEGLEAAAAHYGRFMETKAEVVWK